MNYFSNYIFLLFFSIPFFSFTQNRETDSLLKLLPTENIDSNKVETLNELTWQLKNAGDYTLALHYAQQAKEISEKISYQSGLATAYDRMGLIYYKQGNYPSAIENHFASLKIRDAINDKRGIATTRHNIGNIYYSQEEYGKALEQYLLSLKIKEELGNKQGVANSLNNIGSIYVAQRNFPKALESYARAIKISSELGDKQSVADILNNTGIVYLDMKDLEKANGSLLESLALRKEIGNQEGIATSYINLGLVNIKMAEAGSDLSEKKRKYDEAEKYLNDGLALSLKINSKDAIMESYGTLTKLDSSMGLWENAYKHNLLFIAYRDSITNEENTKKSMRAQVQYEFDKKEEKSKAEAEADKQKQRIILWSVISGLLLVVLFAGFIFRSLRLTRKQKQIIEEKNRMVENKNKDILDSINYAQRIQQALLLPESEIKKYFSDAFVLFKPKDIVSGDFYWYAESEQNKVLAVADCTGHGVPGGFMSMLGFEILNETLLLEEVKTTAEAFYTLDKKITDTLNRNDRSHRDGMDMVLCAFSKTANTLQFSCANRPLVLMRSGEVKEFSPDKFHIGGGIDEVEKKFRNQEIETQKGDLIYLFSDGYADQFGGEKGKKFMYRNLINLLQSVSVHPMHVQKQKLEEAFMNWKNKQEQIDDVLVIGIRI